MSMSQNLTSEWREKGIPVGGNDEDTNIWRSMTFSGMDHEGMV